MGDISVIISVIASRSGLLSKPFNVIASEREATQLMLAVYTSYCGSQPITCSCRSGEISLN